MCLTALPRVDNGNVVLKRILFVFYMGFDICTYVRTHSTNLLQFPLQTLATVRIPCCMYRTAHQLRKRITLQLHMYIYIYVQVYIHTVSTYIHIRMYIYYIIHTYSTYVYIYIIYIQKH